MGNNAINGSRVEEDDEAEDEDSNWKIINALKVLNKLSFFFYSFSLLGCSL